MSIATAEPATHSAPNKDSARQKAWRDEIHTPDAEYNANVPMDAIERDPANRVPEADAVKALAAAIEAEGLLQPIVLRALTGGKYRIIAGEHRWCAYQLLKRKTIPARIYKNEDDLSAARKALLENLAREELTPIERGRRFKQLADLKMSQKEIGALAGGISQPVVANAMRLLELPLAVQVMINLGTLSEAHGVNLAKYAVWPRQCTRMAEMARDHNYPAKSLADGGIPFAPELVSNGMMEKIQIKERGYYSDGAIYKLPRHLHSHRDFVIGEHFVYYFAPEDPKDNVWAPFKAEQDAERKKAEIAAAAKEATEVASGHLTKEALERKKKIKENKAARAMVAAALGGAIENLKSAKDGLRSATRVALDAVLRAERHSEHLEEAAEALGIKLPKDSTKGGWHKLRYRYLHALDDAQFVKLAALSVMMRQAHEASSGAGDVPESIEFVAAGKLVAAETPVEGLTPDLRRGIEKELRFTWNTPRKIGEMYGVPDEWVRTVKRDVEARELAKVPDAKQTELLLPAATKAKPGTPKPKRAAPAKKAKRAKITDETRAMVKRHVQNGHTNVEIAKKLRISTSSVQTIKFQLGLVVRRKGRK